MEALKAAGAVPKWGMLEGELQRRNVFLRQLTEASQPEGAEQCQQEPSGARGFDARPTPATWCTASVHVRNRRRQHPCCLGTQQLVIEEFEQVCIWSPDRDRSVERYLPRWRQLPMQSPTRVLGFAAIRNTVEHNTELPDDRWASRIRRAWQSPACATTPHFCTPLSGSPA